MISIHFPLQREVSAWCVGSHMCSGGTVLGTVVMVVVVGEASGCDSVLTSAVGDPGFPRQGTAAYYLANENVFLVERGRKSKTPALVSGRQHAFERETYSSRRQNQKSVRQQPPFITNKIGAKFETFTSFFKTSNE